MKTVTKFAVAALLALSASVPAFAGVTSEETTKLERNAYVYTSDVRPIAQHQNVDGLNAFAHAPANTAPVQDDVERFQH